MSRKYQFSSEATAVTAMGVLHAAGRVSAWNGRKSGKGYTVRYLTACGKAWFDFLPCDAIRFGVSA